MSLLLDKNMRNNDDQLPTISIVTPSFNQGDFLEECIDSILSQNYPNLEYIIMDGGSSDNSFEIIKKYEKYLAYWQSEPDGGQYNAVNEGFKRTSGELLGWLNSDDKYHRDALFKVAYIFESSLGVEWITGRPTFWGKDGEFTHIEPVLPTYCRRDFLEGRYNQPFIQQESTFWKRSLWERAGGCLRTDLEYAGDLELWIRFFRHALLYSVDTFLGGYRSHGNQKACLFMDRYMAEAESVIESERRILYASVSPDAPNPLELEIQGFREYLSRHESLHCSVNLMASTEEAFQYLLKMSSPNLAVAESLEKLQAEANLKADRLEALYSSRSWRITNPLRWLGQKMRALGIGL